MVTSIIKLSENAILMGCFCTGHSPLNSTQYHPSLFQLLSLLLEGRTSTSKLAAFGFIVPCPPLMLWLR